MEPKLTAHQREILQNAVEHDGTNSARFRLQDLNHLDGLGFLEPYDSYQRATSDRMIVKFVITPSGRAALTESAPATEPTRDDLIAALQKAAEILDEVACFIGTDDETPADLSRRLGGGKRFEVELDVLADILARCK